MLLALVVTHGCGFHSLIIEFIVKVIMKISNLMRFQPSPGSI